MKRYRIGLYEKAMPQDLTWREKLSCAKRCGYDYVELSIDETDARLARLEWTAEERQELLRTMAEVGIPFGSICLSAHRKYPLGVSDAACRARSLEIMEKALDLACDLGIRTIQLAGYDVYYEESTVQTKQLFLENLRASAQMAATRGVMLGFETMETPFMNTVWKAMQYVRAVDSPYLGVYPDSGNLTNAAVANAHDVLEDLRLGKGHLVAMHLKETVPGVFREVPFGTGHVDFAAMIACAWELGIRRFVTEMWDVGNASWEDDIRFAHDSMCALLDAQS